MYFDKTCYIIIRIYVVYYWSKILQSKARFINRWRNSPCFAEIYIQIVEENHIYTMLNASRLWYRKVDITFAIASHDLGEKLQKWNWWDHFTDFAMEKTSKGNLPFLNFIKRLNQIREIMTKVYRKPTQIGHQINHYM